MGSIPQWLSNQARSRSVTDRELEILGGLLKKQSNAEMAAEMFISVRTVESHVSSLLSKFGEPGRAALIKSLEELAPEQGLTPSMPAPLARQARSNRFLGRVAELQLLREDWRRTLQGSERLSMLSGEAGIGKSRLAAQYAAEVFNTGATVLYGGFHEDISAPYEAVAEAVTPYLRDLSISDLQESLGTLLDDLGLIVPNLKHHRSEPDADRMVDGGVGRHRLTEAVRILLQRLTGTRPVLLVLDDLHWASRPALGLLHRLLVKGELGRIHVLLTYRYAELGSDLSSFISDTYRGLAATRIEMSGLSVTESLALIHSFNKDAEDPPESRWLNVYAETKGNPFFLTEAVRADFGARKSVTGTGSVPLGVAELVSHRVRKLDSGDRALLEAAAVLGNQFDVDCLSRVADCEDHRVISMTERAAAMGLVYDNKEPSSAYVREEPDRCTFAHEIVRKAILSHVSPARRRRIHAAAAAALQDETIGGPNRADEIARHTVEAGVASNPEQVPFLVMAGRSALASGAFQDAYDFFDQARQYGARTDAVSWSEITFQMGVALRGLGRWDDALECWRESLDASSDSGDLHSVARTCEAASYNAMWAIRMEEAVQLAQYGVDLLRGSEGRELGRLFGHLAIAQGWSGDYVRSSRCIAAEHGIATTLGDRALKAHALGASTIQLTAFSEHSRAIQNAKAALRDLRDADDRWMLSSVMGYLQFALVGTGRFEEARALRNEVSTLADRGGNFGALLQKNRIDALLAFYEFGDMQAFALYAESDLELCRAVGTGLEAMSYGYLGTALFYSGDMSSALTHFEEASRLEKRTAMTGWGAGLLFELLAYQGNRTESLKMLDEYRWLMPAGNQANTCGSWFWMLAVAEGLFVLGEHEQAAQLYENIVDFSRRTGVVCMEFVDGRLVERSAGIAALAAERWDEAERHFLSAIDIADRLPHIIEAAHSRRFFGLMLYSRGAPGDIAQGTTYLTEAHEAYERLSMTHHAKICQDAVTERAASGTSF
ncbi:AAA family ATPase [Arthrobacter sp. CAU 1506]|uniref:AAA family ATPase n=1 Tax=Arthrobacter sp. CAU 1506 TaxID=2560052 RepID=UPI00145E3A5B|nr:AAA family ATPase [Arthrobacter sp. CAU 1506]